MASFEDGSRHMAYKYDRLFPSIYTPVSENNINIWNKLLTQNNTKCVTAI